MWLRTRGTFSKRVADWLAQTRVAQFGMEHVVATLPVGERIQVCEAMVANVAGGLLKYLRGQLPHCEVQSCVRAFKVEGDPKVVEMEHMLRIMGWSFRDCRACVK